MGIVKSVIIAFSTYSCLPMPQFAWKKEDMRYVLCFFPWVGALVGGCVYLWNVSCDGWGAGILCRVFVTAAIPLGITGGFHADGFLDTEDAIFSYRSREEKLNILKDPHIGSFAVIRFAVYGLVYLAALSELGERHSLGVVCVGFAFSRCLSGIAAVLFPHARYGGTLRHMAESAEKKTVLAALGAQGLFCAGLMFWLSAKTAALAVPVAILSMGVYYLRSKRIFGGITGDTEGYFVLLCEEAMLAAAAAAKLLP